MIQRDRIGSVDQVALALARQFVAGKIRNCRTLLRRNSADADDALANKHWKRRSGVAPRSLSRDAETDIRIYEGEVEHFVAAQTEGVGIRVIRDGRTGFAYAGVLDESAVQGGDVADFTAKTLPLLRQLGIV